VAVVWGLVSLVAVLYAGRIAELGPTGKVFADPLHPYTQGLLAAVPSPDRAEILTGIDGQPPRPGRRGAGCSFAPRCDHAADPCRAAEPAPVALDSRLVRCVRVAELRDQPSPRSALRRAQVQAGPVALLSLRSVSARYGRRPVLSGVDLDVPPQSCVAVVGESGSGKTTLARCVVGLHAGWTGEITFDGARLDPGLRGRPKATSRRIQYIFQNPYASLNPRKTVGQIVAQPAGELLGLSFSERAERAAAALAEVSLAPEFLHRYPDQLSGGERQRVAIARALVVEPDLLICDEVTSALDVSVQAVIVGQLRRLQRERRMSMIFITHNLALLRSIADTAVVLRAGEVVESGPVDQVLEQPQHPYTEALLKDVASLS
jgi:peptide/nickel transport system ATP-binding protein